MVGGNDYWLGLELGAEKLQLFFQSMERPVAVGNMPSFFQDVRDELADSGAQWIVALKWEGQNLGTVLLELDEAFRDVDPTELLEELFTETSRLLSRYDGSHDNADVNLDLVRILVSLREKNCHGTDLLTGTMAKHVARLARVMAFPPDQERDLIYGCLLRDIGLFDRNDDFMDADKKWSPAKREVFRKHPDDGVALLADLKLPQSIVDVVRCHHERFDGKGFPRGLEGHRIPLAARVVAVAEHYAEMVTGSDGQSPLSPEAAAELLRRSSGSRFDPDLVDLFLKAVLPATGRKRGAAAKSVPQEVLEPVGS
jgi:response regulator RpfG family c-di-GMP phosphodiesterase